jgi:hypothetical protein
MIRILNALPRLAARVTIVSAAYRGIDPRMNYRMEPLNVLGEVRVPFHLS